MKGQNSLGILIASFACLIVFVVWLIGYPFMQPWLAEQTGKAELAQAEQNRQIAIVESQAKLESSKNLAQAEIERAKGVAEANRIIGESLKNNSGYLDYLWITEVAGKDIDKTVVYVPTENNLPILEAGRLPSK